MDSTRIALITGANKGIGYEIARQLGLQGITVYIGSRNESRGITSVNRLITEGVDARLVVMDVKEQGSIRDAASLIEHEQGHLDILVNNAGIIDPDDGMPGATSINVIRKTFETNFFGALLVTQSMLPLLRKASAGRIVNISSGLGSLNLNQDPGWAFADTKLIGYNTSKAALNMLTVQLAWELKNTRIKVNAANPNFTDTDLVPGATGGRPVSDGARTAVELALLPEEGPTGGFFEDGLILPW
ncbi:TPA: SDR family oxidoreductase [Enterobacter hormaechei]|uniref:SDR family oxidoreductase n=1 Tax=Atlantibacter hermannii TaxID=565 RepID=UPI0028ADF265|nr:SDR family oxidoreductase [Atlantibacter hermannii]MDU7391457.1 SDR family oxidoreductase [Atlantibacter hermannii]